MPDEPLFLRTDVIAEPLVGGWYAWPHLISPATCAMNVAGRHLKIMSSYIEAPHFHATSVKDPKMLGGPFIDHPAQRVPEIQELIERTRHDQAQMIELSTALHALHALLKREASGFTLDALYARLPEALRGYVEIFYDLANRPGFRLFESLLYRSRYYDANAQSLHMRVAPNDNRPFVLSTPRLPSEDSVSVRVPFESHRLDQLFRTRYEPAAVDALAHDLGVEPSRQALFHSFFTPQRPRSRTRYEGAGARIRYFGHACMLLETREFSLLTDPVVSFPFSGASSRYTYDDLPPRIDYVVITHNHQDHVLLETLLQLRHAIGTVILPRGGDGSLQDPSLKLAFKALGFKNVIELDELETLELPGGALTGLPFLGEHADLNIRTKLCHHVRVKSWSTLFAADSCAADISVYRRAQEIIGDIDVLYLGMECDGAPLSWLYGPLLAEPVSRSQDRSRKLSGSNFERAVELVEVFHPKQVYVYAMGQEPWLNHVMALKYTLESLPIVESDRLLAYCKQQRIVAERLYGIKETFHGESL